MSSSEKGKIKNLKSKLEGNRLDLSLSDLTVVPSSKEILNLKKATEIDLSRNRLQVLTDDFCLISNLTWLDLNSNQLKSLPEQFGKLSTLQHLDLYKNQLTDLPISFCHLKQLRFLDLKDNPLKESLRSVAGEFLEEKDCKQASQKVVQYMQKLQSDQERERQKRLKSEREAEAARKAVEDEKQKQVQQEKKKQKENRKKAAALHNQQNSVRSEASALRDESTSDTSEQEAQVKHRSKRYAQRPKQGSGRCGWLWKLCKFLFVTIFVVAFTVVASATFLYINCTGRREILPKSRALCHDVYLFMSTGQLAPLTWDYTASALAIRDSMSDGVSHAIEAARNVDVEGWKAKFIEWNAAAREKIVRFVRFAYKHGGEYGAAAWEVAKIWALIAWDALRHLSARLFEIAVLVCRWLADTGRDLIDNYPAYWEKVKYYWKNLK